MGLSFFETMRGELSLPDGSVHPMRFQVKAEARRLRDLARTGRAQLSGTIHAPPFTDAAPLRGWLTMRPGNIAYILHFSDDEDRACVFTGAKTPRGPVRAFVEMHGALEREGAQVATGWARFDLRELPAFLGTFTSHAGPPRAGPACADAVLTPTERATLATFSTALIHPGTHVPPADAKTVADTIEGIRQLPTEHRVGLRACLRLLDATALATHRRLWRDLPLAERRTLLTRAPLEAVARALGAAVRMAHFNRPDYLAAIGVPDFKHTVREPAERWTERVRCPADLATEHEEYAEVVIVGTGAGGAALAAGLAERGVATVLIEAGRLHTRAAFSGDPIARSRALWRDAGATFAIGAAPASIPLGRMVGGTTAINSGTCLRPPAEVLEEWRTRLGFPDEFTADHFERWVQPVMDELQVTPADPAALGHIARVIASGADAMGLTHGPLPRNAPGCDGQGVCIFGCPTDARRSSNVSWVPRALNSGAALYTGMPVRHILRDGRRAIGVEAQGVDRFGQPKRLRVRANAVVIACGSLQTPLLLADNNLHHPSLGQNLSIHPALGLWVRCAERMDPWAAIPQGYGVNGLEAEGIRYEGYWLPPGLAGASAPVAGAELTRWMDAQAHVGQFGFMVRDGPDGSVRRGPSGRPHIRYTLSDRSIHRLRKGASVLAELMLRGGGEEVLSGVWGQPAIRTVEGARALANADIRANQLALLGAHPLGTTRMGPDPQRDPIDLNHRVRGTDNVYVVDGGAVPSSLGVNPQITIMALALRAAEHLADRYG